MKRTTVIVSLLLLSGHLLLAACTGTPAVTPTETPTLTPSQTATQTATVTPSATPGYTSTPETPAIRPKIFFSVGSTLYSMDRDGSNLEIVARLPDSSEHIFVDSQNLRIYFTTWAGIIDVLDLKTNAHDFIPEPINGGGQGIAVDTDTSQVFVGFYYSGVFARNWQNNWTKIVSSSSLSPLLGQRGQLQIDSANRHIYFRTAFNGNCANCRYIYRVDYDGKNLQKVIRANGGDCLALDLQQRQMYFSNIPGDGTLWRANLDGSSAQRLFTLPPPYTFCRAIALDLAEQKMYLSLYDQPPETRRAIARINLDGSGYEILYETTDASSGGIGLLLPPATDTPEEAASPTPTLSPTHTPSPLSSRTPTRTPSSLFTPTVSALSHGPGNYLLQAAVAGKSLWLIYSRESIYLLHWDLESKKTERFDLMAPSAPFQANSLPVGPIMDSQGQHWFYSADKLFIYKKGEWRTLDLSQTNLAGVSLRLLTTDSTGKVWLVGQAGDKLVLAQYEGNTWKASFLDQIQISYLADVVFDSSGNVWISAEPNVIRVSRNNKIVPTMLYMAPDLQFLDAGNRPFALLGNLVIQYNGEFWQVLKQVDETCLAAILPQRQSSALLDRQGQLWLGFRGGGILVDNGQIISRYSAENTIVSNNVLNISQDTSGNIWVQTDRGVSRFDGKVWTNYYISEQDGQPHEEIAPAPVPATFPSCIRQPRFKAGDEVVVVGGRDGTYVYSDPLAWAGRQLLRYGSKVKIVKGPAVFNGPVVWYIQSKLLPGEYGWINEETLREAKTTLPTLEAECSYGWSRILYNTQRAIVIGSPGDPPNRLRSKPELGDNVIGLLYPGTIVEILQGPVCRQGLVYWKVRLSECPNQSDPYACRGQEGWTAEGNWAEYWMAPYP